MRRSWAREPAAKTGPANASSGQRTSQTLSQAGVRGPVADLPSEAPPDPRAHEPLGPRQIWLGVGAFLSAAIGAALVLGDDVWLAVPIAAVGS